MKAQSSGEGSTVWKLTLAYDGTEFHGWQVQPGRATIQGALSDAVARVTGERVMPQGSGRTDAGVHAWGQVASFSLRAGIPRENFQRALNRILPAAIRVRSTEHASPDFHARHSAIGKIYKYRIFHGRICSPFLARYVTCCRWPLNLDAMREAAIAILGEHDFISFAAFDPDRAVRAGHDNECIADAREGGAASNVRRIDLSEWSREALPRPAPGSMAAMLAGSEAEFRDATGQDREGEAGEILTYTVRGNGFLHHMVRNLVGTFVEVGRGRMAASEIQRILDGSSRALAGPTAAANGLCLMKVLY